MFSFATAVLAAEGAHHELNPLWFPAPLFGLIMLLLLASLAFVTFTFRDVANRHAEKAEAFTREHEADEQH